MSSWLNYQWCPRWEYSNSASCDHSTMDRNTTETNRGQSWCNKKNKKNVLPSLDFFFRTRVPPNFPRKDSSFLIFADCVLADVVIFWVSVMCLWSLSLSLSLPSVNNVTPPCDAFRHRCTIQSQRNDTKQPDGRLEEGALPGHHNTEQWLTCE